MAYGYLIVIKKTGEDGSRFPLSSKICRIGKGHDCDVRIQRERVMEEHCVIEVGKESQVKIRNLAEGSQTVVNGSQLSMEWVDLKHMDKIFIGDRSFRWEYLKGSKFYSEIVSCPQSEECNAQHKHDKLSEDKPVNTAPKSLVSRQSENLSPHDDLISFDSPLVVSDLKRQNRKSRSSMLGGIKLQALTKEKPTGKTPSRRASIKPNGNSILEFSSSPISLMLEGESSFLKDKSQEPADMSQKTEISIPDEGSAVEEKSHASHKSSDETEGKKFGTHEVESDSIVNSKNERRRSSRGKSIGSGNHTPSVQKQNLDSSVVNKSSECNGMRREKSVDSLNKTADLPLEDSLLIESTPRVLRNTSTIAPNANQQLVTKSRDSLHKSLKGRTSETHEISSFPSLTPCFQKFTSRSKKSIGRKSRQDLSVCTTENVSSENLGKSVKIVVVPPSPEPNHESGKHGDEVVKNPVKFSVWKNCTTYLDSLGGSSRKSKLDKPFSDTPSKLCEDSSTIECVEDINKEENKKVENCSLFTSESGKSTPCSRRVSCVNEIAKMNNSAGLKLTNEDVSGVDIDIVTDVIGGDWIVTEAEKSSRRGSLRSRKSLNTSNLKDQSSVFQDNELPNVTKTPLPSDEEYASWLSQVSRRTSVASTSDANPSSPIIHRNLRKSIHDSSNQSYFESIKEAMKTPLSISLQSTTPVQSGGKSMGSISGAKEKMLSPSIRSNRKSMKSIGTPCFVASLRNRLKTPTTVCSEGFEVSDMEHNSNEFVTVRRKNHIMSAQKIDSDDADYLSDISTNNSGIEDGEMDSLMQTSSLMLDQSDISTAQAYQGKESEVKSSWTSTPAVSKSTRKKRVTFGGSLCSEDLGQLPQTPQKLEVAPSGYVSTPASHSFRKQSMTGVNGSTRESLKRNVNLIETPSKNIIIPATPISYLSPKCGESVIESSFNSALDNTITLVNTPSMLDRDASVTSIRSLRSCKSSNGDSPLINQNVSKSFLENSHKTPTINTSLKVVNDKDKPCGKGRRKSSVLEFDGNRSAAASPVNQGEELETKTSRKGREMWSEEVIANVSPVSDVALNLQSSDNESVNGQEWNITNKGTSSRKDSLRSRKSFNVSSANELSSVYQDMTKTPIPSDEEYASWLSQVSRRTSVASTNNGNLSNPILQRSHTKSTQEASTPGHFKNEDVIKTPIRVSLNSETPVQSKRKSMGSISGAKEKMLSPSIRSNRKSMKSIGTPCFVASLRNRLKTPTTVCSEGFEVSDMEHNSNEFVTVRRKNHKMSAQKIDSDDADYLSDISTNNSGIEDGEMDSLMQTSSLMLDQSDISTAQAYQGKESEVKSSWTSTPAVRESARKKRITFGGSLCSEDLGQLPQTPQKLEVAPSGYVSTPASHSFRKQSMTRVNGSTRESLKRNSNDDAKLDCDSSANSFALNNTDNFISNSIVLEQSDSQMSTRSLRRCKSEVNKGSNSTQSISRRQNRSTLETRSSPSLVSTSWVFKREAEVSMESHQKVDEDVSLDLAENKSGGRKSSRNDSLNSISQMVSPNTYALAPSNSVTIEKAEAELATPASRKSRRSLGVNKKSILDGSVGPISENVLYDNSNFETNASMVNESDTFTSALSAKIRSSVLGEQEKESLASSRSRQSKLMRRNSNFNFSQSSEVENADDVSMSGKANISLLSETGTYASAMNLEEQSDSEEENAEFNTTIKSEKRKSTSLKRSIGSTSSIDLSIKFTPNISKVTRSSASATPDYTESMKDLLKTPAITAKPVHEEDAGDDTSDEFQSPISVTESSCPELRRLSIRSSAKVTPQPRKLTRKSVNATPDYSECMNDLLNTPAVTTLPIHEKEEGSVLQSPLAFTNSTQMEIEIDSLGEDVGSDTDIESGKRKSSMRKSSIGSSTKKTPQITKVTRRSVSATPDYSESMKDLMKTPAVTSMPVHEEDTGEDTSEELQFSISVTESSRPEKRSSCEITPQTRKSIRKSVTASPDYFESVNDLLKTPAEKTMSVQEEIDGSALDSSLAFTNLENEIDSQGKDVGSDTNIESGKRKSSMRKSSIGSSTKKTPQITNVTRRSVSATPDYYESMKDLMKTPAVTDMPVHEENTGDALQSPISVTESSRPALRRSSIRSSAKVTPQTRKLTRKSVNATPDYSESINDLLKTPAVTTLPVPEEGEGSVLQSPLAFTNSTHLENEIDSQEENVGSDTNIELGKRKSNMRKSSIGSTTKKTPQITKVTRRSVSATPDYSDSMKDLMKTPATTAMPIHEEDTGDETSDELQSPISVTESSRPSFRRSFINSSAKVTHQTRKITRNSVNSTPDYSESMNDLLKTPTVTTLPINEEEDGCVIESPLAFTNSTHLENEIDSQEVDVGSNTNIEPGKRKSSMRKSSIISSTNKTPQITKVTRRSVSATPDYSESMKGLLKTPAITAMPMHEEDTGDDTSDELQSSISLTESSRPELRRASIKSSAKVTPQTRKLTRKSVNAMPDYSENMKDLMMTPAVTAMPVHEEDTGDDTSDELQSPISVTESSCPELRSSSIRSSAKVTPKTRQLTRKSVNATPDYSDSMNYLLKTPSATTLPIHEEEDGSVLESPLALTDSTHLENKIDSEEVDVGSDTNIEPGKRKSSMRKSSIISSTKMTPQIAKVARRSVSATPDYSESMKDLMKTPAVTAMPVHEENTGDALQSPISVTESSRPALRRSSIRSSAKVTPQTRKLTRKSVNATPDYSESINDLLKTPAVTALPVPEEGEGSVLQSPLAFTNSTHLENEIDSQEEGVGSDTSTEPGKRKSLTRKKSIGSITKMTPQISKVTRRSVSATPDYSDSMKALLKTPAATALSVDEEDTGDDTSDELQSPISVTESSHPALRRSSIRSSAKVTPQTRKLTRKSGNATPDYSESMKDLLKTPALPVMPACEEENAGDITREVLQTPSPAPNSSRSYKGRSSVNAWMEALKSPSANSLDVEEEIDYQEGNVESNVKIESSKRKSIRRKSSISSSVRITPLVSKVSKMSVTATPDHSESMKYLLKTPAITAILVHEEEDASDATNEECSKLLNTEDDLVSQEQFVESDATSGSGLREYTRGPMGSSGKITPYLRKSTRNSMNATPDYSERMRDLLKTPAITSLRVHEEKESGEVAVEEVQAPSPTAVSSCSFKSRSSMNCQKEVVTSPLVITNYVSTEDVLDSQEEGVESEFTVQSGKRMSVRRKSSIGSYVKITPQVSKLSRKSVNVTPDISESMMELLKTPAVTVMPVHEGYESGVMNQESLSPTPTTNSSSSSKRKSFTTVEQEVGSSPLACTKPTNDNDDLYHQDTVLGLNFSYQSSNKKSGGRKSTRKMSHGIDVSLNNLSRSDEMNPLAISSSTNPESLANNIEEEKEENLQGEYPAGTDNDAVSSEISPTNVVIEEIVSEANLEVGSCKRKSVDRQSSDGHENVKWMKRWLVPKSPASRYSDIQGIKKLFSHKSPQSSYSDVTGLEEMFASPIVRPSEVKSTVPDACLLGKIPTPYRNPVVVVSKLYPDNSRPSLESKEISPHVKSHGSRSSTKIQSNGPSQRPTRRTKAVEAGNVSSEVHQSELGTLCGGKENKVKIKKLTGRKETKSAVVVEDLLNVNDECVSIPDTSSESVILKSNLRNIAGQRGLRKHVHFEAKDPENSTQKVESVNEDGPSVTRKASTRKPVVENPTDVVVIHQKLPSSNGKDCEESQNEEDKDSDAVPRRRGNLRKRGMTVAVEDGETNAMDDVTISTKQVRASRVTENEKQASAVERTSRRKKAEVLDEGASNVSTDADKIGGKLTGGSKKKAEFSKDVKEKLEVEQEVSLGRQTRRRRGTERTDVTISVNESKTLEACSIDIHVKSTNEKENVEDSSPENHLPKKDTISTEVQGGSNNLEELAQRHTRRGKKAANVDEAAGSMDDDAGKTVAKVRGASKKMPDVVKDVEEKVEVESAATIGRRTRRMRGTERPDDTIPMGLNKSEEPSHKKSNCKSGSEKENSEDKNPEKEAVNEEIAVPARKGRTAKKVAVKPTKQMVNEVDTVVENKGQSTEDSSLKPSKPVEKGDVAKEEENEETAQEPEKQRAKKQEAKPKTNGKNKEDPSVKCKKGGEKVDPAQEKIRMSAEDTAVISVERRTRRGNVITTSIDNVSQLSKESEVNNEGRRTKRNMRRVSDDEESREATSEKRLRRVKNSVEKADTVECGKKKNENSQMKKVEVNKPEDAVTVGPKLSTRRTKVTSSSGESSVKDSFPSSSENVKKGKRTVREQNINVTEEEPITKVERSSRHKRNVSSSGESSAKDSLPSSSEKVQKGKRTVQEQSINVTEEESITKVERTSRHKRNVSSSGGSSTKDSLPSSSEKVQEGKRTLREQNPNVAEEEPITKVERASRHKRNVSNSSESSAKDSLPSSSEKVQKGKRTVREQNINVTAEEPITKVDRPSRQNKNALRKVEVEGSLPKTQVQSAKVENIKKPSKAVCVDKNKDEEDNIPKGRNLHNSKNAKSDTSEMNETKRPSKKRIASASLEAPSAAEEKSRVSREEKEKEISVVAKPAKRAKLSDNNEENVVVKTAPKRVLRKR